MSDESELRLIHNIYRPWMSVDSGRESFVVTLKSGKTIRLFIPIGAALELEGKGINIRAVSRKSETRGDQIRRLSATSRSESEKLDRRDKRLRFGEQTNGWWFIPPRNQDRYGVVRGGGPYNWVPAERQPTVIRGYHYKPGQWMPIVPPRREWSDPQQFAGIPGQTPWGEHVPEDVREAAHTFRGERKEIRMRDETASAASYRAERRSQRPMKRTTTQRATKQTRLIKSYRRKRRPIDE